MNTILTQYRKNELPFNPFYECFQVNIIPVISKADTLTPDECHEFKREILREIELHKISIYQFPDGADEEENKLNKKLKERIPFAVIGSNAVLVSQPTKAIWLSFFQQINEKRVRARQYPWGIAEIENEEHCDFKILRNMLIRTHMQVTNNSIGYHLAWF